MRHLSIAALLGLTSNLAHAHAGHGFNGAHFHAAELFVPALLAAFVVIAWVWRKR